MSGKAKKAGAPGCGLYVRLPPSFISQDKIRDIRQIFFVTTRSDYERNMHAIEFVHEPDSADFDDRARPLIELVRANGFAAIVRGGAVAARRLGADGVLLASAAEIAEARALFGEDGIVGLRCGLSRDRAEEALAAGIDYVSFGYPDGKQLPPEDIISWWAAKTTLPALVEGDLTNDDCDDYIKAGAAFLDASGYILNHPEGIMKGTTNMLYAIDLALEALAKAG